jgi:single-strand DNA-binding protein
MAQSYQKVILVGNLGADPEIRTMQDGRRLCSLRVATSERWKRDGEWQEKTEWHTVTVWVEALVDALEKYSGKGSKVLIEGKLETRKWTDKDGKDRYTTEVVVRPYGGAVQVLDGRESGGERRSEEPKRESGGDRDLRDDLDDDVPW